MSHDSLFSSLRCNLLVFRSFLTSISLIFDLSPRNVASQLNGIHILFNEDSLTTSSLHNTESVFHFSEPSGYCNYSIENCSRFIVYQTESTGHDTELVYHYTCLEGHGAVAFHHFITASVFV